MALEKRQWTLLDEMNIAEKTKDTYNSYFRSLYLFAANKNEKGTKWYKLNSQEEYLQLADDEIQLMLERFLDYQKNRVKNDEISPNTIPKFFKAYKIILDANYREHAVKWKPISLKYPPMEKRSGYKPWKTTQIEEMLSKCNKYKKEAAIQFQASTGGRVGVHDHPLLMKHMIKMEAEGLDYHCYAILIYAESDETVEEKDQRILNDDIDENDYSFFVFLIPEAARVLDKYHEWRIKHYGIPLKLDSPIFRAEDKHGVADTDEFYQMSGNAFRKMMENILKKTTIKRVKKRNRYDVMMDHGFRKRFNTILKIDNDVNSNIAEKLMQHKKGLDGTYLTPTREECFKEFVKAITELTIDQRQRQKEKIREQQEKIVNLEKQKTIINKLQNENQDQSTQLAMLQDDLKRQKEMIQSIRNNQ